MGGQLLHADLRRLPAARRPRGRPARAQAALSGRARHLHGRLAPERARDLVRVPDPRPRAPGPRRRPRLARGALDRDDHLRRGLGADEGDGRLERDRGRRRCCRPAARRDPDRPLLLALDLLRQPPGRDRRLRALAPLRPGVEGREGAQGLRRRRSRHGDRRPDRARVRAREGGGGGLALAAHARLRRPLGRAAGRLRLDRAPVGGAARAPEHLPPAHDPLGEHRDAARCRGALRDVLLQLAVLPACARLLADRSRARVRALHARDRDRRRSLPVPRQGDRAPVGRDRGDDARRDRDAALPRPRRERHLPHRSPARDHADLDRDGDDVRSRDPDRDERDRRRRRGPRLGAPEHVAADRRRARTRDPLDARDGRRRRARSRAAATRRRGASSTASTSPTSPAPPSSPPGRSCSR